MYKIDLHTHSIASPDGGITEEEYREIISKKILDFVAITDHNRIDFAQKLNKKFGVSIIIGEEIMTREGEVIGLFLKKKIQPFQNIEKTINEIYKQNGLVYIPHPFDKFRHGIGEKNLLKFKTKIDIIEGFNGRMIWKNWNKRAKDFVSLNNFCYGVGSDTHGINGLGLTYGKVKKVNKNNLKKLLENASFVENYQPFLGYLRPILNKIRIKIDE